MEYMLRTCKHNVMGKNQFKYLKEMEMFGSTRALLFFLLSAIKNGGDVIEEEIGKENVSSIAMPKYRGNHSDVVKKNRVIE